MMNIFLLVRGRDTFPLDWTELICGEEIEMEVLGYHESWSDVSRLGDVIKANPAGCGDSLRVLCECYLHALHIIAPYLVGGPVRFWSVHPTHVADQMHYWVTQNPLRKSCLEKPVPEFFKTNQIWWRDLFEAFVGEEQARKAPLSVRGSFKPTTPGLFSKNGSFHSFLEALMEEMEP